MKKPTDKEIKEIAKEECSFPKKCYPNDIMEIQCKLAFINGAKWAIKRMEEQCQNQ